MLYLLYGKGTRLYINITNRCNTDCPFCCMYSGTGKTIDMKFDVFRRIVDDCDGEFEIQFEGGEPLIHKNFYLFLEYAIATGRCKKVNILMNTATEDFPGQMDSANEKFQNYISGMLNEGNDVGSDS